MKNFGYILLLLVMVAGSAWAIDQVNPTSENAEAVNPQVETATEAVPEVAKDEPFEALEITEQGQIIPLDACCFADCASAKAACIDACGPTVACRVSCSNEFIECTGSC